MCIAKANRVHMVFHIYHSTLTSFNINYIIWRNVEIFKYNNNNNNNNKSKEHNFVKRERREYFGIVRNILVLFDMDSSKLINYSTNMCWSWPPALHSMQFYCFRPASCASVLYVEIYCEILKVCLLGEQLMWAVCELLTSHQRNSTTIADWKEV